MISDKITAIMPFKVIQGHRFWYQSIAYVDFLLVINTNLPSILHRFRDITFDVSKIVVKVLNAVEILLLPKISTG